MNWTCPHDRTALAARDEALACSACGRVYAAPEGIPIFATRRARPDGAPVRTASDELWARMRHTSTEVALAEFCVARGCSRAPFSADWKFFFPVKAGTTVLELGAGVGQDTAEFLAAGAHVVAVVPTVTQARIVARIVGQPAAAVCSPVVLDSLERLPVAEHSVTALALESAAAAGFDVSAASFPRIAAEWRRVVAPGGTVFLGLGNRLHDLPGARLARRALASRPRAESLNRVIKRDGAERAGARTNLGIGPAVRAMAQAGFGRLAIHAPLPDENDARIVIPLDDPRALRYFLSHLVRRNSRLVRAAVHGASVLVALDLLRHVVPYYYLLFRAPERP